MLSESVRTLLKPPRWDLPSHTQDEDDICSQEQVKESGLVTPPHCTWGWGRCTLAQRPFSPASFPTHSRSPVARPNPPVRRGRICPEELGRRVTDHTLNAGPSASGHPPLVSGQNSRTFEDVPCLQAQRLSRRGTYKKGKRFRQTPEMQDTCSGADA